MTRQEAREREALFIERFRTTAGRLREVRHPIDGRVYPVNPSTARVLERDSMDLTRRLMERLGLNDSTVLGEMPTGRMLRLEVSAAGWFSRRRPKVVLAAVALSPGTELLRDRSTDAPVGPGMLREAIESVVREPEAFHYVGVCATTRFAPECLATPPQPAGAVVVLVEPAGGTAWRLAAGDVARFGPLVAAFDPESEDERVVRCRGAIAARPELSVRGGHILWPDLAAALARDGYPEAVLARALAALGAEGEYVVRDVGDRRIVQRARFPREGGA